MLFSINIYKINMINNNKTNYKKSIVINLYNQFN